MRKSALRLILLVMVLSVAVFGFAASSYAVDINCNFQDNKLVWQLRVNPPLEFAQESFFAKDNGNDWTCDPGLINVRASMLDGIPVNNAVTTGVIVDENADNHADLLTVTVDGAYPCYYNSVSMLVDHYGSETVMPGPVLHWMGHAYPIEDYKVYLLLDDGTIMLYPYPYDQIVPENALIEFKWKNNTGRTLYEGDTAEEVFDFHILKGTPPPPGEPLGLTPGYWKNWRNHYTEEQFSALLQETIAGSTIDADGIFANYSAKDPVTILKAHLLATQLTLNLSGLPDYPNPGDAYLTQSMQIEWGGIVTVGEAVDRALDILANPTAFTKQQILAIKNLLDYINNLGELQ